MSPILRSQNEEITREAIETPLSLWNFTEEENMLRETGQLSLNSLNFVIATGGSADWSSETVC